MHQSLSVLEDKGVGHGRLDQEQAEQKNPRQARKDYLPSARPNDKFLPKTLKKTAFAPMNRLHQALTGLP